MRHSELEICVLVVARHAVLDLGEWVTTGGVLTVKSLARFHWEAVHTGDPRESYEFIVWCN